ncbi:MAG: hypothetical protein IJU95_08050 [Treponema sp.]|nr:hypothetical protein [Treponema sp.]
MAESKAKTKKTGGASKKSSSVKDSSVGRTSKEIFDKGLEASKKWFESAKKTISDWGDEGVKQVEIAKLNSKLNKGYSALGKLVYAKLAGKKGASVSTSDEEIGDVIKLLYDMNKKVKKLGGDGDKPEKAAPSKSSAGKSSAKASSSKKKPSSSAKSASAKTAAKGKPAGSGKMAQKKTSTAKKSSSGSRAKKAAED